MHAFCTKDCCSFVKDCKTEHRPFDIKRLGENCKREGHFRLCPSLLTRTATTTSLQHSCCAAHVKNVPRTFFAAHGAAASRPRVSESDGFAQTDHLSFRPKWRNLAEGVSIKDSLR